MDVSTKAPESDNSEHTAPSYATEHVGKLCPEVLIRACKFRWDFERTDVEEIHTDIMDLIEAWFLSGIEGRIRDIDNHAKILSSKKLRRKAWGAQSCW